jgi:hypothetical protein
MTSTVSMQCGASRLWRGEGGSTGTTGAADRDHALQSAGLSENAATAAPFPAALAVSALAAHECSTFFFSGYKSKISFLNKSKTED